MLFFRVLCVAVVALLRPSAPALHERSAGRLTVPDAVIVGRAICGGRTWLLTDSRQLIGVDVSRPDNAVRPLNGFGGTEQPWGLACTSPGELWTLASSRSMVRMSVVGQLMERVALPAPQFALFGVGNRFVYQQLPVTPGSPALWTMRRNERPRPWPGLVGRAAESREGLLGQNLIACGIGDADLLPCWFANESEISISDGVTTRRVRVAGASGPSNDAAAPIHDVAVVGGDMWVLTTAVTPAAGRLVGRLLLALDASGGELARLELKTPARLMLGASGHECWLLAVDGSLIRVVKD